MLDFRILNRQRTISQYCNLTNRYAEYVDKCARIKDEIGFHYKSETDANEFLSYIIPAVERFCGQQYREGKDPDVLPHRIAIAIAIKFRRSNIRKSLEIFGCPEELNIVYALMKEHGMIQEAK